MGPGTAQTWIGTLKLDGPPLELKYDVMGPRPKSSDLQKKKKKVFAEISIVFPAEFRWAPSRAHGPPKHHEPRGRPLCPSSRRPSISPNNLTASPQ